jgi:hypothetical protein
MHCCAWPFQYPLFTLFKKEVLPMPTRSGPPCVSHSLPHATGPSSLVHLRVSETRFSQSLAVDQSGGEGIILLKYLHCGTSALHVIFAGPYARSHPSTACAVSSWAVGDDERAAKQYSTTKDPKTMTHHFVPHSYTAPNAARPYRPPTSCIFSTLSPHRYQRPSPK